MIFTGIIFGLGLSELALVLVAIVLILGPKRISTIKPFLKVAYKSYLKYMREVQEMQGEMDDMKKTIMEPIEEVEREAAEELKGVEREASEGLEGAEEIKKGLKELVRRSKREMEEARRQARMEEAKKPGRKGRIPQQNVKASHVSRGAHVGLLGRQGPGSSRRQPSSAVTRDTGSVSLANALKPEDKQKLFGKSPSRAQGLRPGRRQFQRPQQQSWFARQPQPEPKGRQTETTTQEPVVAEKPVQIEEKPIKKKQKKSKPEKSKKGKPSKGKKKKGKGK